MNTFFIGLLIYSGVCIPLAVAWHSFIDRYFRAALYATLNAIVLLTALVFWQHQDLGNQVWVIGGLLAFLSFFISLTAGIPFAIVRRSHLFD